MKGPAPQTERPKVPQPESRTPTDSRTSVDRRALQGAGNLAVQRALGVDRARAVMVAPSDRREMEAERVGREAAARGIGSPANVRRFVETRTEQNLIGARLHTDESAHAAADALSARAFTVGSDVFFARGQYQPGTKSGTQLLAHELTHVAQQRAEVPTRPLVQRQKSGASDAGAPAPTAPPSAPTIPDAGSPVAGAPAPAPATPTSGPPPAAPAAAPGPEAKQSPVGDIIIALPSWEILELQSWIPKLEHPKVEVDLLTVPLPIPEIPGANINVKAIGSWEPNVSATFGPIVLKDIRIGLTYRQAVELAALVGGSLIPGVGLTAALQQLTLTNLLGRSSLSDIRGLAYLSVPATGFAGARVEAGLKFSGRVLSFEVVSLQPTVFAGALGFASLELGAEVGLYILNGHLKFNLRGIRKLNVGAEFYAGASVKLSFLSDLFSTEWGGRWTLASFNKQLGYTVDDLAYDNGLKGKPTIDVENWIREGKAVIAEFIALMKLDEDKSKPKPEEGEKPATAPTGKTQAKAIPMIWVKPAKAYPASIKLEDDVYQRGGRQPLHASVDARRRWIGIGGPVPGVGTVLQRRGTARSGTAQSEFRKVLEEGGYDWGHLQADHVVDLMFGGADSFNNLWPCDPDVNTFAGTWHAGQGVWFSDEDNPEPKRLTIISTPLEGRFFRISEVKSIV